jgi:hypothetical protein
MDPSSSLTHYKTGLDILKAGIASKHANMSVEDRDEDDQEDEDEAELRRKASRALVGMTEIYLTDLW